MDYLVHGNRMLAGLGVCYGTARDSRHALCGNAQEVLLGPDGFVPAARPLTGRTLYDLASLTKLFTCLCVLRLREDGRLSLDERFGEADPRFPGLRDVTVGDVLSFRAYLRSPSRVDEAANRTEALARVFAIAPAAPPAVKLYTDMNALALGHLVESRADMELYEYVQRAVLRPAGMTETFCRVPPQRLGDCANYNYECRLTDGRPVLRTDAPPGTPHDPKARVLGDGGRHLSGHAGLFSTLGDMTRLAQALLSGEVLPPAVVREIGVNRTGRPNADGTHVQYLGYQCFSRHPQQRLSEVPAYMGPCALGLSGFTGNHLSLDPEAGVFALFLGNRAARAVDGRSYPRTGFRRRTSAWTRTVRDRYAGRRAWRRSHPAWRSGRPCATSTRKTSASTRPSGRTWRRWDGSSVLGAKALADDLARVGDEHERVRIDGLDVLAQADGLAPRDDRHDDLALFVRERALAVVGRRAAVELVDDEAADRVGDAPS